MNLLMISGDRSMMQGKQGAFWYTLEAMRHYWGRIDVICPRVPGSPKERVFWDNVHFHASPYALWRQPKWIAEKGKELVTIYKHSVMTVHEYPPFYNGIGAKRLWKKTHLPYVIEIHHIVGHPIASSFTERIGRFLSRWYLLFDTAKATSVRTVNKTVAQQLIQWGVERHKIKVVPSFYLDPKLFQGEWHSPQYDVAFCGRLVANKGVLETIRAVQMVEGATLVIIGDGPERDRAELLVRELNMQHRVEFRGWLPTQEDVIRSLRSARAFVMNSKSEGGPRIALEAMSCGLPVVSTKVGVMPDVIIDGNNGMFTTGEPADLADKLKILLGSTEMREKLGQNAKLILERFERDRLIANYANYLQTLA